MRVIIAMRNKSSHWLLRASKHKKIEASQCRIRKLSWWAGLAEKFSLDERSGEMSPPINIVSPRLDAVDCQSIIKPWRRH
jgi:hypothetical protein